ncbi:MAG: hypothetical protein ISN64_00280 [Rickettsia sp.]|nr:hypothetical protein [Rickettsia sp.]
MVNKMIIRKIILIFYVFIISNNIFANIPEEKMKQLRNDPVITTILNNNVQKIRELVKKWRMC